MTYTKMNQYIKRYIENDKTNRAIMLTGPWGCGKSYYIQNDLILFLRNSENGNYQCAVVSLYGMDDLSEISK